MQRVGLKNAKRFKDETDNEVKYEAIRKFYELRRDLSNKTQQQDQPQNL